MKHSKIKTTAASPATHAVLGPFDLETVTGGSGSCCPTEKGKADTCPPGDKCHSGGK
jgi:hypothetical protein